MEEGMKKGATWPCSVVEVWELREGRGHVGKSTGKLPERKRAVKGWAEGAERGNGHGRGLVCAEHLPQTGCRLGGGASRFWGQTDSHSILSFTAHSLRDLDLRLC